VNIADVVDDLVEAWIAKVLINTASSSAITTRIGNSRQNDRCLRLLLPLRRWAVAGAPGSAESPAGAEPSAPDESAAAPGADSASGCRSACAFAAVSSAAAGESVSDLTADPESRASDAALSCGPLT
jgi:hypothetical protein